MPNPNTISLNIGDRLFDIPVGDDFPFSVNFAIEDEDNFDQKKGTEALNITVPATLDNSRSMNTFFEPNSEDYSPDNLLVDAQPMVLNIGGVEFLKGKALLKSAVSRGEPVSMEVDLYANNADWIIENSELTIHDVVNSATHLFEIGGSGEVDASWAYNGTDEGRFFVYAPARYGDTFEGDESVIKMEKLRPSLFIYWLLYAGFRRAGYKINSAFMDSEYFRRMVIPWCWGNFLYISDTELDALKFRVHIGTLSGLVVDAVGPPSIGPTTDEMGSNGITNIQFTDETSTGAFDNSGSHNFVGTNENVWTYNTAYSYFGLIQCGFELQIGWDYNESYNSYFSVYCVWSEDTGAGWTTMSTQTIVADSAPTVGSNSGTGDTLISYLSSPLSSGNKVKVEVFINWKCSALGSIQIQLGNIGSAPQSYIRLAYFKIPTGGIVDFKKYPKMKEYKWIDLLRGVVDQFDLQIGSDSLEKTVYIEPNEEYVIGSDLVTSPIDGYYRGAVDWSQKKSNTDDFTVINYSDFEQIFTMKHRDDSNDGMAQLISTRQQVDLSMSKYKFPSRFKKGEKVKENRFFSPVVHYDHVAWTGITGAAPQLVCLIPENIANTSKTGAQNTLLPKMAYYAGQRDDTSIYGGWNLDGDTSLILPFMFAVNYKTGGEVDPILTYNDQNIQGARGFGLFKRFFRKRFAIYRHGKRVTCVMMLNNTDALDFLQRELKVIGQSKFKLINFSGYMPLKDGKCTCTFWMDYPVTQVDDDNTFPSEDSVIHQLPTVDTIDPKYARCLCLSSDIPI